MKIVILDSKSISKQGINKKPVAHDDEDYTVSDNKMSETAFKISGRSSDKQAKSIFSSNLSQGPTSRNLHRHTTTLHDPAS